MAGQSEVRVGHVINGRPSRNGGNEFMKKAARKDEQNGHYLGAAACRGGNR